MRNPSQIAELRYMQAVDHRDAGHPTAAMGRVRWAYSSYRAIAQSRVPKGDSDSIVSTIAGLGPAHRSFFETWLEPHELKVFVALAALYNELRTRPLNQAEIEADLRRQIVEATRKERERIVAWLRNPATGQCFNYLVGGAVPGKLADMIEDD